MSNMTESKLIERWRFENKGEGLGMFAFALGRRSALKDEEISGYIEECMKDVTFKIWERERMLESNFKDLPSRVQFRECIADIVESLGDIDGR